MRGTGEVTESSALLGRDNKTPVNINGPFAAGFSDQSPSRYRVFCDHKVTTRMGYAANGVYALAASSVFAILAYKRAQGNVFLGIVFPTASAVNNAPMAFFFAEETKKTLMRLHRKQDTPFKFAFALGFALAAMTTFSGLALALDSAQGVLKNRAVSFIFCGLFAFNVFSTRLNSSTHLLHDLYQTLLKTPHLKKAFSSFLKESRMQKAIKVVNLVTTLGIIAIVINMTPLWFPLTVQGLKAMKLTTLSRSPLFVSFCAASNQLFYIRSALDWASTLQTMATVTYQKISARGQRNGWERRHYVGAGLACVVALGVWGVLAYFSGKSYGEALKMVRSNFVKEGSRGHLFGPIAQSVWFSWMGWYTNPFLPHYGSTVACTSAGLFINGRGSLKFIENRILKAGPADAQGDDGQRDNIEMQQGLLPQTVQV